MTVSLTGLAHGGGCGCKLDPSLLSTILSGLPAPFHDPAMLVGIETRDDAVVYRLDDDKAVVATTDFFMPVVDDPGDFGAIAACNAISDIYAVGGRPLFALAIAGMPSGKVPAETVGRILAGGAEVAARAGIVVGGGHSIDSAEPIYGLAVVGLVHPDRVKRNSGGRAGDVLVLGKALGVGVLSAAFKRGRLPAAGYDQLIATTTRLNAVGERLGAMDAVHAMTDVTGFSLMGHLHEVCEGSGLSARLVAEDVPLLTEAVPLAQEGISTGAGRRNAAAFGAHVRLPADLPGWQRDLLFDPQTSGGLLVAVDRSAADAVLALFRADGHADAAIIGSLGSGAPEIEMVHR